MENGRPAIPPVMLGCACVLQFYRGFSDREMEEACMYDIRIKHALGLEIDERPFDHSTLGVFRKRLLENGKEKEVFERIVSHLVEKKLIKRDEIQRIDATHIIADLAIPSMIVMLKKCVYGIFKVLKVSNPDIYKRICENIRISDYRRKKINQDMPGRFDMEKRRKKLVQIVLEAKKVLKFVEGLEMSDALIYRVNILRRALHENIKQGKRGRPAEMERGERPSHYMISPIDPDARYGAKSKTKHFVGYKANLTETVESRFITNIKPMPGSMNDGAQTVEMVKEQRAYGIRPPKLIGDAAYTIGEKRKALKEYGTQVVAPLCEKTGNAKGIFAKNKFKYNEKKQTLTCPNGITTSRTTLDRKWNKISYHFPQEECEFCDLHDKCTNSEEERRIVTITSWHNMLLETEAYNRTKQFKDDMKLRQPIEGKISEMKRYHNLTRTRYRGMQKFGLQIFFTACAINIKHWMKLIVEKIKPKKKRLAWVT
jgi:hypothetical protein